MQVRAIERYIPLGQLKQTFLYKQNSLNKTTLHLNTCKSIYLKPSYLLLAKS